MKRIASIFSLVLLVSASLRADAPVPLTSLARMPVKEVTVFKDGHAFVMHSGKMPTDAAGNVTIDALPNPVLGTFWPYSAEKEGKLLSVVASARKVKLDRTAMSIRELIEANIGAEVSVTELPIATIGKEPQPITYLATILAIPAQSGEELEATSPPNNGEKLSVKGNVVLMKTSAGVKAVDFSRIVDVTFVKNPQLNLSREEFRGTLMLKLDWAGKPAPQQADVGMVYLQKGIRWIPNYKVTIDGKGAAIVQLQATLINEMIDLENVTTHLVIGVPSFLFATTPDPIGLQQAAAQLSQYFANPGDGSNPNNTGFAFGNSIMTQQSRMGEVRHGAQQPPAVNDGGAPVDLGPDVAARGKSEDLFLFSVKNVTLKKGQRMTVAVASYNISYKDTYTLSIPVSPPPEVFRAFDDARKAEITRMLNSPKVMHKIRLFNKSDVPFTTAPAVIVQNDRLLAQGMMTYTSPGAAVDIDLTTAIDVSVKKTDEETRRTPDVEQWQGEKFFRIDLAGKISLTSYSKSPVEIEVTRYVIGGFDSADKDGKITILNALEDSGYSSPTRMAGSYPYPAWYYNYSWPWWWAHLNMVGKTTWELTLEPGKTLELNYKWHYFWR